MHRDSHTLESWTSYKGALRMNINFKEIGKKKNATQINTTHTKVQHEPAESHQRSDNCHVIRHKFVNQEIRKQKKDNIYKNPICSVNNSKLTTASKLRLSLSLSHFTEKNKFEIRPRHLAPGTWQARTLHSQKIKYKYKFQQPKY